jgi:hypothetical protein
MSLAKYIGVMSKPENEREEKISMTVRFFVCLFSKFISITKAPVSMGKVVEAPKGDKEQQRYNMRFFLPASEIKSKSEAPQPSKENVRVVDVPERTVAVRTFSGYFRKANVDENTKALLESLRGDEEVKNVKEDHVEVFGWNPPWTISFLRTNEVLVPCDFVPLKK